MTTTDIDVRKIVLPKTAPKAERDKWQGRLVEIKPGARADTKGQVECTLLNRPDRGRELWFNPLHLMELELSPFTPDTKGEA